MDELTYTSIDEALADAAARASALRALCALRDAADDDIARELDVLRQVIEAIRAELNAQHAPRVEDGDAVHRRGDALPVRALTRREHEVLQLMALGLRNKEIAAQLDIAERTAAFHVGNILSKLGADGRVEALRIAYQARLLDVQASSTAPQPALTHLSLTAADS